MLTQQEIVDIMISVGEAEAWRFAKTDPYYNEERVKTIISLQTKDFTPVANLMAVAIINELEKRL